MTDVDSDRPLSLANEFRSMVTSQPAILERFPNLYQHLLEYPRRATEDVEDIVYWSKEKMGPAVIISPHYFDSSLGMTILLDVPGGTTPGMIMAYVNRSRLDALGGFCGGLKRTIVRSRTRSAMGDSLVEARDLVERRYRMRIASSR